MNAVKLLKISLRDNVAIALEALTAGTKHTVEGQDILLQDDIAFGHKVALCDIASGEPVIKYGYQIGVAKTSIDKGSHVHSHNLKTALSDLLEYTYQPEQTKKAHAVSPANATFDGYVRPDGRVGTRNEVWIIPTVGCVNETVRQLCSKAQASFGHLCDGFVACEHPYGCSQLGEDQRNTQKVLTGLANHPNAGAVLIVSLGCENNNLNEFLPLLGDYDHDRIKTLTTQEFGDEMEGGMRLLEILASGASRFKRTKVSTDRLVVGLKCGGSDAFSGITANRLCGYFTDSLVEMGGTVLQTEVPEMFGAEQIFMNRAVNMTVFKKTVNLINDFKQYYIHHAQPIYENPSPGNKAGGITTLEEKSIGCTQKGGTAPVVDVLGYAEPWHTKGLNLLYGPGNDLVSTTNLVAAGAQIVLFTTGRGTPAGTLVPTVKISSNTALAERKPNWIDYDAGQLMEERTKEEITRDFMEYVLEVASGKKLTNNEKNGYRDFAIFKEGVTL